MLHYPLPVLGVCAYSGTGKTTLLTQLLPLLKSKNLSIAVIKHAHHDFDIDQPGKDSYEIREAGAEQVLIASRQRMALMKEFHDKREEPNLEECLFAIDSRNIDLILVEGFKHENISKIELHRSDLKKPFLFPDDKNIIAVATDKPLQMKTSQQVNLDLNNPEEIAEFIIGFYQSQQNTEEQCQTQ